MWAKHKEAPINGGKVAGDWGTPHQRLLARSIATLRVAGFGWRGRIIRKPTTNPLVCGSNYLIARSEEIERNGTAFLGRIVKAQLSRPRTANSMPSVPWSYHTGCQPNRPALFVAWAGGRSHPSSTYPSPSIAMTSRQSRHWKAVSFGRLPSLGMTRVSFISAPQCGHERECGS
jgi:hypothetical protein